MYGCTSILKSVEIILRAWGKLRSFSSMSLLCCIENKVELHIEGTVYSFYHHILVHVCELVYRRELPSVFSSQFMAMTSHQIKIMSLTLLINTSSLVLKPIARQIVPFLSFGIRKISEAQLLVIQSEK